MAPEDSLLHSQEPVTCLYPEPHRSSPALTSHFLKINLNIILPSTPRSSKWSPSLRFPHQYLVYTLLSPYASHPSRFDHPNNIGRGVQNSKLLVRQFSPLPCYLIPLRPKCSFQHPILKYPQPTFLPQCERPSLTPTQNNRQNCNSVYLNLCISG